MMNVMTIGGFKAVLSFDPEAEKFRGKFVGLTGEVSFEAADVPALQRAGELALHAFQADCQRRGVAPAREFTGELTVVIPPRIHEAAAIAAAATGVSLDQWVTEVLQDAAEAAVGPMTR
ncbi:type II toxin-antitoxin system HicB family antitoxin [Burkholderia ubonensis]|uniref:type II toxin-antitoxin system HicB family antitoxin n=1 Tax=Burkholderia ubonensis TaxID=101571 RepID=UPI0009B47841|nr:type II toxin-antitoxin system HicB family antitoxin [Burkholderia ubonensis]